MSTAISVPGLLAGVIDYEIKSGNSNVHWTGPRIPAELWHQVLAFFKDTFDRTKAECQVRLYVNTITNTWAAWAYPQEAAYSMAIKEMPDHPQFAADRAQFKEDDGWIWLGTAHHHCAGTAFQSGTDKHGTGGMGETQQDGLHITIGSLHLDKYDIHARFYFDQAEFDPDLSEFWDVGNGIRDLIPKDFNGVLLWDGMARTQMCKPAPAGTTYPEQWKQNILEVRKVGMGFQNGSANNSSVCSPSPTVGWNGHSNTTSDDKHRGMTIMQRREHALSMAKRLCKMENTTDDERNASFVFLRKDPTVQAILKAAIEYQLPIFDIVQEFEWEGEMEQWANNYGGME